MPFCTENADYTACYNRVCNKGLKTCTCSSCGAIPLQNGKWVCSDICAEEIERTEDIKRINIKIRKLKNGKKTISEKTPSGYGHGV